MGRSLVSQQRHNSQESLEHTDKQVQSTTSPTMMVSPPLFYTSAEEEDESVDNDSRDTSLSADEPTEFLNQVAGHVNGAQQRGQTFGIVKFKEALLKPIPNPVYYEREALFYERLQKITGNHDCAVEPDVLIRNLVPKYFGRSVVQLNGTCVQCLVIEDLTRGMREPCVMDVKIGRRTWDPDASYEKMKVEEAKYIDSKREFGFCIPGFQVYDVKTGALQKFDKNYGRHLNRDTTIDALRNFLNCQGKAINRVLLVQLLVDLWHIQRWARKQQHHRLFSSSILLIYDARRLRQLSDVNPKLPPPIIPPLPQAACSLRRTNSLYRPLSLAILNDKCTKTGFSGQLNKEGPIFPCRARKLKPTLQASENNNKRSANTLKRMHSFQNNYDEDLRSIRTDYTSMLEDLVADHHAPLWGVARMIDFAHAFPADAGARPDYNYLDGIDNLVQILETFLAESDVQE